MEQIKKTTNYSDFKTVKGNRLFNKEHLSRLKKSIQRKNLLQLNPVIVNEKMEIIDGQHRILACKQLGLPVYYIVGKGLGFDDVVQLNSNVKDWSLIDYLDSYCEQDYEDYLMVKVFAKKYGLSPSSAIAILSMNGHVTRAGYKNFKEGNFEIYDIDESKEFASRLRAIARFTSVNTWKDRDFIRALSVAYEKGFEHEVLLERIERNKGLIMRQAGLKDYLRILEDIYNAGTQSRVRLY